MRGDHLASFSSAFLRRLAERFASMSDPGRPPLEWVGAKSEKGRVIVIYRERPAGPELGRVYDLKEYSSLFSPPQTAEALADIAFTDDFEDPTGHGQLLDVDWAFGITTRSDDVEWIVGLDGRP